LSDRLLPVPVSTAQCVMVFSITLDGESLFDCIGENNPTGGHGRSSPIC
jgi:hypothetical protein